MVKADLIARTVEAPALEGPVAQKAVEALFKSLYAALQSGDRVVLPRFGDLWDMRARVRDCPIASPGREKPACTGVRSDPRPAVPVMRSRPRACPRLPPASMSPSARAERKTPAQRRRNAAILCRGRYG